MCVGEHEDHKFLQNIFCVNGKEVFQLVHGHEPADLGGEKTSTIKSQEIKDNKVTF